MSVKLGLQLWNQSFSWEESRVAAVRAEDLGYDSLWTWEHPLACMGAPDQDTFDAYTLLTAWSQVTSKVSLGALTGANTFWNPGLLAKKVTTLDHVSTGRAICGLGAGWFELEHRAFGIEFGSGWGDRLGWLNESAGVVRRLLDGETVTSAEGDSYSFDGAYLRPLPVQEHLPIMIGGGGEQKTLRTVARYADMWDWVALEDVDRMRAKHAVFEKRCEEIDRDPAEIERTAHLAPVIRDTADEAVSFFRSQIEANRMDDSVMNSPDVYLTTPERLTELMAGWSDIGVSTFILQIAAPFDDETASRIATDIRPLLNTA